MYNRTQKPNEPAEEFIASIGSYISRLGLGENDYKDNLIRGFNSHIRSAILEKSPENLSQVIHIALAAEAAKQLHEESKSSRATKSMETLFPWETDAEASTALHNLQRLLQSVLSTQQHISPVQSLVTSNPISNPPLNTPEAQYGLAQAKAFSQAAITEAMPQPHYQPPRHLAFTCNYCGGAGHFAAACPSDPRNSLDPQRPPNPQYNPRFSRAPQRPFQQNQRPNYQANPNCPFRPNAPQSNNGFQPRFRQPPWQRQNQPSQQNPALNTFGRPR